MLPSLEKMLISPDSTIREALSVIDCNAQGTCFVAENKVLVGALTDGDIRRALLSGKSLETQIHEVMQKDFVSLSINTPNGTIQERLSHEIRHIPLIDKNNRIVDYACLHRYRKVPIMEPLLDGNELSYVTDCIKSNWISSQGAYVKEFESMFRDNYDVSEALAVCNGTVALHLALESLGIGEGDEVIVPDFTFAASINAIIHSGATPVLVDVTESTWTICPQATQQAITPKTKAIMPVHLYGHPCDMGSIMNIAQKNDLFVVADAAEALGSEYKEKPVADYGDAVVFSFFGNKTITTGEGGVVLFKDPEIAKKASILRDHGMSKQKRYWHEYVGYNYRMTNLQAAIGVAQMERLDEIIKRKRELSYQYIGELNELKCLDMPPEADWAKNSFWLFTVMYNESEDISRDALIEMLMQNGVETRPTFYPIHQMPPYKKYIRDLDFPITEKLSRRGISLPSSVSLTLQEIKSISAIIQSVFMVRKMSNG